MDGIECVRESEGASVLSIHSPETAFEATRAAGVTVGPVRGTKKRAREPEPEPVPASDVVWSFSTRQRVVGAALAAVVEADVGDESKHALAMLRRLNKDGGELLVVTYEERSGSQRITQKASSGSRDLASCSRRVRAAILPPGLYVDVDIKNAMACVLAAELRRAGIPCEALDRYLSRRDECLRAVMDEAGESRDEAKKRFITVLNGGGQGFTLHSLKWFQDGLAGPIRRLLAVSDGELASVSQLYFARERAITKIWTRVAGRMVVKVAALIFDGALVEGSFEQTRAWLAAVTVEVERELGIHLEFTSEVFGPTAEQAEWFGEVQRRADANCRHADATVDWPVPVTVTAAFPVTVEDLVPPPAKQTICVAAPMGMEKSTATRKYLERLPAGTSVLFVTPRVTLAVDIAARLKGHGFVSYKDADNGARFAAPRLVIEYESLHRIADPQTGALRHFDVVVLDEAASLAGSITSAATNGARLVAHWGAFCALLRGASTVIATDADLEYTPAVCAILRHTRPVDGFQVHRYTHCALLRTLVRHKNRGALERELLARVRDGRRVLLACRTKAAADRVLDLLKRAVPGATSKLYHGKMDEGEKRAAFSDVGAHWTAQVIALTSTCTVGVSYEQPMDSVWVLDGLCGPTPREMLQICGRCRVVTSGEVHVVAPPPRKVWPRNWLHVLTAAILAQWRELREQICGAATHTYVSDGRQSVLAPEPWAVAAAHCAAEGNLPTQPEFCRLAEARGWGSRWAVETGDNDGDDGTDSGPAPGETALDAVARAVHAWPVEDIDALEAEAAARKRLGLRTEFDQELQTYWPMLRRLDPAVWRTARPEDQADRLKFIKNHWDAVLFRALFRMTEEQAQATVQKWTQGQFADWAPNYGQTKEAVARVARLLNLESPLDTARDWAVAPAAEAEIKKLLSACVRVRPPKTATGLIRRVWGDLLGLEASGERERVPGQNKQTRRYTFGPIAAGDKGAPVTVEQVSNALRISKGE